MRTMALRASICVILLMAGCARRNVIDNLTPEEATFAKTYLESVRGGNIEVGRRYLDPDMIGPETDQGLIELIEYFPAGELVEVSSIGFKWEENLTEGVFTGEFSFQYHCEEGWAITHITLKRTKTDTMVTLIEVNPIPESLESMNRFTLKDKSQRHYLFLGLAFVIPVFIVWSAAVCLRTPIRRRKWLWLLFILFGLVGFTLNWSDGYVGVEVARMRLLGASAEKQSPYAPWLLTVSVPLGAIIFLARRRKLIAQAEKVPRGHRG